MDKTIGREANGNIRESRLNTEVCIRCGKATGIPISTPVEKGKYFVEGSGQLCEEC